MYSNINNKLYITIVILIARYIFLESGLHNSLYTQTNGLYNGYIAFFIILYLLHIPLWIIIIILLGRYIYRSIVSEKNTDNTADPLTNIMFGAGVYIGLMYIRK